MNSVAGRSRFNLLRAPFLVVLKNRLLPFFSNYDSTRKNALEIEKKNRFLRFVRVRVFRPVKYNRPTRVNRSKVSSIIWKSRCVNNTRSCHLIIIVQRRRIVRAENGRSSIRVDVTGPYSM